MASWSAFSSTTGATRKEHATYLAEQGEIVKNDTGSFLVLEKGSVQRLESGQRDPRIVTFDRYAFDLSKFAVGPQTGGVTYNRREKYIWELDVAAGERRAVPGAARRVPIGTARSHCDAALSDRLCRPRLRLSRAAADHETKPHSVAFGLIGVVALLRLVGFLSVILGTRMPGVLAAQYVALFGAIAAGSWQISRGQAIEPAAAVSKIATIIGERLARATAS